MLLIQSFSRFSNLSAMDRNIKRTVFFAGVKIENSLQEIHSKENSVNERINERGIKANQTYGRNRALLQNKQNK